MKLNKDNKIIIILLLVVIVFFIIGITQFFVLRKAHSTFENYYKFRGCAELIEKTDTYSICKLSSGQTIKLVNIRGRWYLDGDGPGIF